MHRYFIIYKPYLVLSQFSPVDGKKTLSDFFSVPKDVYPVGRLDYDSEGLLILTNDTSINHQLLNPKHKHEREYWVQVEGDITSEAIDKLAAGVIISIDGKSHLTKPCNATVLTNEINVPERHPPIRYRKNISTTWISLVLTEGKNRQVRRMTASVGFPTLRLIRMRIENVSLREIKPGEMKELSKDVLYQSLFNKKSST
ncbi:MAG TPA: pseudouridine synthase [Segetibacter sp.]|jgi:23S rRNA pseudouridine2457 synthase